MSKIIMGEYVFTSVTETASKNYPKSFELYSEFWNKITKWHSFFTSRFLYDFFDSNGIYISIKRSTRGGNVFLYAVEYSESKQIRWIHFSNGRHDAERSAFLLAFKMLENKIITNP